MANQASLNNLQKFTKETASEKGRIGGIKRGQQKKKEKEMREWAKIIGGLKATVICPDGSELKGATLDADLIMQQYKQAHKGNTKAATFIARLTGQLKDKLTVSSDKPIIVVNSQEEKEKVENIGRLDI